MVVIALSIGEREARLLLAHLMEVHSSVVAGAMPLGELLRSFTIVEVPAR